MPGPEAIDAAVSDEMARTGARGLAIAVVADRGPGVVPAWGARHAARDPRPTATNKNPPTDR